MIGSRRGLKKYVSNMTVKQLEVPEVDILKDEGIWIILDEVCNSNCHGDEWARNCEEKLKNFGHEFTWINHKPKGFNGIGGKVQTVGKREMPAAWTLEQSGLVVPGKIQSHKQIGSHPLLLSKASQAQLGFIKNMQANTVYMKRYGEHLPVRRAKRLD